MKKLAVFLVGLTVVGALVGCDRVTEFRMDMDAAQFRQECFGNPTYDCINRRVNFNEKLINIAKRHWEDAHDQAVPQIGEQRFQIVVKSLDNEYARQENDRPFFFMRWFFGDHQVPYETSNLLFDDDDLERVLAEAIHTAKMTPGLQPLQKQDGVSDPAPTSTASSQDQLSRALETPVDVISADNASVANDVPNLQAAPARPQGSSQQGAALSPTLAKLFVADAVQGNVGWLESVAGSARQVQDNGNGTQNRIYQVDGCKVTVLASEQIINELSLDLGPSCNVSLKSMVANGPDVSVNGLMFADLFRNNAGEVKLQCAGYSECGNSADPTIQATVGGSHADNFLEVIFSGTIAGDQALVALQDLMKAESTRTGKVDIDLDANVYNKDPQFSGLVRQKLGGVRVTALTFKSNM